MRLLWPNPNRCRWRISLGECDMRKRLVAGLIILCMCLCSCGKKEEGIEQETEEQEEVITEGIGNGGAESGATTTEAVEIADPWESGRTDETDGLVFPAQRGFRYPLRHYGNDPLPCRCIRQPLRMVPAGKDHVPCLHKSETAAGRFPEIQQRCGNRKAGTGISARLALTKS